MVARARGLFLWLLALGACRLDLDQKTACRSQADCVGERVCVEGWCTLRSDGGTSTDHTEAGASDADGGGSDASDPADSAGDGAAAPEDVEGGTGDSDAGESSAGDGGALAGCGPFHVTPSGSGDGSSWSTAANDLATAIENASARVQAGCEAVEVWVAAGVYRPPGEVSRSGSFELRSGVAIYGGFAGHESELSQRDVHTNLSVLSGDREGDDASGNRSDNSYHVVRASGVDQSARLDGFVITAANADSLQSGIGGGLFYTSASPTLEQLVFVGNRASQGGAGLGGLGGHPRLKHVVFAANESDQYGGGVYFLNGQATLEDVLFVGNWADSHGGALAAADVSLRDVAFVGNVARSQVGLSGGLGSNPDYDAQLTNALFVGNEAYMGAAAFVNGSWQVFNATFARNVADDGLGNGIAIGTSSSLELTSSVAWHNTPGMFDEGDLTSVSLLACDVQGPSAPSTGNLSQDPEFAGLPALAGSWSEAPSYDAARFQTRFTDAGASFQELTGEIVRVRAATPNKKPQYAVIVRHTATELWVWGDWSLRANSGDAYEVLDLRLASGSPCLNAGQPGAGADLDIEGRARDANPNMGAYEYAP